MITHANVKWMTNIRYDKTRRARAGPIPIYFSHPVNCISWDITNVFFNFYQQYFLESLNIIISAIKVEWSQQCLPEWHGTFECVWPAHYSHLFLLSSQLYFLSFLKCISSSFHQLYILESSHHHLPVGVLGWNDKRHLNAVGQLIIQLSFYFSAKNTYGNLPN